MADKIKNETQGRSWFIVFNNPEEHGYTGETGEILDRLVSEWVSDSPTRTCAMTYCVSADGLRHVHMVVEDSKLMRFSAVKKAFPFAHLEPTKGSKEQAEDYICKRGKFKEKGEIIVDTRRFGEIKGASGSRKDLEVIEVLIEQGLTPEEIMEQSFSYRRYEKMIRQAFFAKRNKAVPFVRDVKVYWHVGASGSGKTYTAQLLMDKYGEQEVFVLTDYESGGFDTYFGQKILFLEEFRGQFRYSMFLNLLDKYKYVFHARYTNITGLWNEVHITSIMPPEDVYKNMIQNMSDQKLDPIEQLKRRISVMVFHYKQGNEYKTFELPMTEYVDYEDLKKRALGGEFYPVSPEESKIFSN